jgi:hypothetical protein
VKRHMGIPIALAAMTLASYAGLQYAGAQAGDGGNIGGTAEPKLVLTTAQRSAIYQAVSTDKSKVAPIQFSAVVGADVPPMIQLYALPDDAVSDNPAAKFYEYTVVQDEVVLVDPTKMRVIDIIGPPPKQ